MSNYLFEIAESQIKTYLKSLDIYDDLYNRNDVTEIMINTNKKIFVKVFGQGFVLKKNESSNDDLINMLKILSSLDDKVITADSPKISTKMILNTGQKVRIEGLIPPVVENPTINIRKQSSILITVEDYLEKGFINEKILEFFKKVVKEHKNILVIGGTDTGKTTLTNSIINLMERDNERIVAIEEVPELQLFSENVNRIQIIPKIFSSLEALKYCMRASPERIVFGEIREGESAYEFINGLNSGHQGGISTIHANDGIGGLKKLEMYINSVFGKPLSEEIGMTIDVLITVKMKNYKRYLASIDICKGYDREKNRYILENVYSKENLKNNSTQEEIYLSENTIFYDNKYYKINSTNITNIVIEENEIIIHFSKEDNILFYRKKEEDFDSLKNKIFNLF
ncbi:ATPase, T2SS/T4P/T4SS family [Fusobacterium sp. SYSU M8D902]|uniref:ATPase, T2SS/T4P/T4SS family n=1 Tax=Fusobacterium sp. SYSU M8D902 TaxID=3159562 RepID=UPI0032E4E5DE